MSDKAATFTDQMPLYQCFKQVRALKIKAINEIVTREGIVPISTDYELVFENEKYGTFKVSLDFMQRTSCVPGGYLIRYEDGYLSFSPAKAFEEGYVRLGSPQEPLTVEELNRIADTAKRYPLTEYELTARQPKQ